MANSFETSKQRFAKTLAELRPQEGNIRNEAATRLHVIDRLLFECLDWEKSDCAPEVYKRPGFADYELLLPHRVLIVEAKREGIAFEVPAGITDRMYQLRFFEANYKTVWDAIKQCMDYCLRSGVPLGCVSNGHQWIIFLASRLDGTPPFDGDAVVFSSFDSIASDYLLFWNCLSKASVASSGYAGVFRATPSLPPPEKLARRIPGYPGFQVRNQLQAHLQALADIVLVDTARIPGREEDFLRHCYSRSGALSQFATIGKSLLESRYSRHLAESMMGSNLSPATTRDGYNPEILAARSVRRPILLLGDVGVGKTTFIRNLILVDARKELAESIVLYLDFADKPTLEDDLRRFTYAEMASQLHANYEIDISERNFVHGIFHLEIEAFDRGIYGDLKSTDPAEYTLKRTAHISALVDSRDEHMRRSLLHLAAGRKKEIVVFLDNVDKRGSNFEQEVFRIASGMASNWPVTVFVALRPETYYQSKASGALSAFHATAFTVSPPRLDQVLSKRLRYALALLDRGPDAFMPEGVRLHMDVKMLREYLEVLLHSLEYAQGLMEFIDNVAAGNVRLALDFVREFVGSGHVKTDEILRSHQAGGYTISLHQFLRAVLYKDHLHYDPRVTRELPNLFDIAEPSGPEHFLLLTMLAFLDAAGANVTREGFASVTELAAHLQGLGYKISQIGVGLERALRGRLVEIPSRTGESRDVMAEGEEYRITTVGSYMLKSIIFKFAYVDAMVVDTPIIDREARQHLKDEREIHARIDRLGVFLKYLDEQWALVDAKRTSFNWIPASTWLRDEGERIRKAARRAPRRR